MMIEVTEQMFRDGASINGAWNRAQIEVLGVEYPPRHGWKRNLIGKQLPAETVQKFINLKNAHFDPDMKASLKRLRKQKLVFQGGRIPGKTYEMFIDFIAQVRSGKRTMIVGPEYVIVSRNIWDEMKSDRIKAKIQWDERVGKTPPTEPRLYGKPASTPSAPAQSPAKNQQTK